MNRALSWMIAAAVVLAVAWTWLWLDGRRTHLADRETLAESTAREAATVLSLRGQHERASMHERPRQDLIGRLNAALTGVGIPQTALNGVTVDSDGPLVGTGGTKDGAAAAAAPMRAQAMRVALRAVALPEFGKFLERWRDTQTLWTPTTIEVARAQVQDRIAERFDITLVLTAVYVAPSGVSPNREVSKP